MDERFAERMRDREVIKDTRLLGDFTAIYCRGRHKDAARASLASEGAELGVYGNRPPVVCEQCAELLRYAEKRRAFCPKDPKPFCSNCDTHCYRPDMREYMRDVMRYAGPRSMLHGHAIDGIRHLIEGRKHKKERHRTEGA
ncbi:MAG: nitrous oxide-stimulated promoter family protein [Coriobacteriia bacterium]|nr:nitrous oxide-stimulated promoter family protein [Coriobacteriia bacterium]